MTYLQKKYISCLGFLRISRSKPYGKTTGKNIYDIVFKYSAVQAYI